MDNEEFHNFHASPNIIKNDQIKKNEMGRACSTHGRDEKCIKYFGWKTGRKETT
jgi:hypothetical protein